MLRLLTGCAALLPWLRSSAAAPVPATAEDRAATLAAMVDTLMPADSSPGATALGVDKAILEAAARNANVARIVNAGCDWLAQEADGAPFAALPEPARVAILERAEQASAAALQNAFFRYCLDAVYRNYYAHPDSWPALGYQGPPQPAGFPDQAEAPGEGH
ncbi:MAG: gluconate 2-dehydrogenase subunit 3 family protein [Gammaproteobacteria bacterium]|nr:gluconate 2-dehydrogenase subunit 3 family protein [Gammaproteobacteria bacterium]